MRRVFLFLLLAAGFGTAVSHFFPQLQQVARVGRDLAISAGPSPAALRGAGTYEQFCQHCHGLNKSPAQAGMVSLSYFRKDAGALARILSRGSDKMPVFDGMFEDEEIRDLHAYLSEDEI